MGWQLLITGAIFLALSSWISSYFPEKGKWPKEPTTALRWSAAAIVIVWCASLLCMLAGVMAFVWGW